MCILQRDGRQLIFSITPFGIEIDVILLLSHHLAIGIENTNLYRNNSLSLSFCQLLLVDNLSIDLKLFVILGADIERMARDVQQHVGDYELDITI